MPTNYPSKTDESSPEQLVFLNHRDILINSPIGILTSIPESRYISVNYAIAEMLEYDTSPENKGASL